jgi:hypothetical protein
MGPASISGRTLAFRVLLTCVAVWMRQRTIFSPRRTYFVTRPTRPETHNQMR